MMLKESHYEEHCSRRYITGRIDSPLSAVTFIGEIRSVRGIATEHIDVINISTKKCTCKQHSLDALASINEMMEECEKRKADALALYGEFNGRAICIAVDLKYRIVMVSTSNDDPADVDTLEKLLHLA